MADSPLQKAPVGLLGAFDLKTLGDNPTAFARSVQPVVESLDMYLSPNAALVSGAAAAGALGATIVNLTVPQNGAYRVKGLSVVCARVAGDAALNIELVVNLIRAGTVGGIALFTPRFEPVPATDLTQARALWLPRYIWAAPGDTFRLIQRSTLAGGTLGVSLDADVFAT